MSNKSTRRRATEAEPAEAAPTPEDTEVRDPQEVIQEVVEQVEIDVVDDEPAPTTSEETHDLASLAAASQRLFNVSSDVVFGAAHHASLSDTERLTIAQVREAIEAYLRLPV